MSEHTPGPWTARQHGADWVVEPQDKRLFNIGDALYHPENEANARLIAAAPELLAAGKGLLDFIRARFPDDFVEGGRGFTCEHHRALEAAIAKAEGR